MELVHRWENPVLIKDLRTRMRGGKAFWLMTIYTVALLIAFGLWYLIAALNAGDNPKHWSEAGKYWFTVMFVLQAVLVVVLMPAFTSGGFTLEHEQRTFELLVLTTLTPTKMVLGRLLSAIAFVALLIACSLPYAGVCFMLGSVAPSEVIISYLTLLLLALFFGSLGLACSTFNRRTAASTLLAYTLLFAYWGATAVLSLTLWLSFAWGGGWTYSILGALEPIQAVLYGAESGRFFGRLVPLWVVGCPIYLILIWLFTTAAVNNFPYHAGGKTGWLRLQTLLLFVALTLCFAGVMWSLVNAVPPWVSAQRGTKPSSFTATDAREFASAVVGFALGLALLFVPIFCTKSLDRLPREGLLRLLAGALNPLNFFRGKLRSAPLYLLSWLLLSFLLLWMSFQFGGGSLAKVGKFNLLKLYAVALTTSAFCIMAGVFLTLLLRPYRVVGIILLYCLMLATVLIPAVVYMVAMDTLRWQNPPQGSGPWWMEGVYLSPMMPLIAIADPSQGFRYTYVPASHWWLANAVLYGFFTLALTICNAGLFKWGHLREQRQSESMSS